MRALAASFQSVPASEETAVTAAAKGWSGGSSSCVFPVQARVRASLSPRQIYTTLVFE